MKPEKNYETKRNFTFNKTKRNETKFRCLFSFALFRVSRNKKRMQNGNPGEKNYKQGNSRYKTGSLIWRIRLKHAVKIDSVVKLSAVASCACCGAANARLGRGQRTGKGGGHTAVDQVITFRGFWHHALKSLIVH
jgi:hypothetical protein